MKLSLLQLTAAALLAAPGAHAHEEEPLLRGSAESHRFGMGKNGATCISNGGINGDRRLTADQVCSRDFAIVGGKDRVAYKCQTGARWACCYEDQCGESCEQPMQNLGTCTRYKQDEEKDEVVGAAVA